MYHVTNLVFNVNTRDATCEKLMESESRSESVRADQ